MRVSSAGRAVEQLRGVQPRLFACECFSFPMCHQCHQWSQFRTLRLSTGRGASFAVPENSPGQLVTDETPHRRRDETSGPMNPAVLCSAVRCDAHRSAGGQLARPRRPSAVNTCMCSRARRCERGVPLQQRTSFAHGAHGRLPLYHQIGLFSQALMPAEMARQQRGTSAAPGRCANVEM